MKKVISNIKWIQRSLDIAFEKDEIDIDLKDDIETSLSAILYDIVITKELEKENIKWETKQLLNRQYGAVYRDTDSIKYTGGLHNGRNEEQ